MAMTVQGKMAPKAGRWPTRCLLAAAALACGGVNLFVPSARFATSSRLTKTALRGARTDAPSGQFKVVNFAAYVRVETARMMLAMTGHDFDDFRYLISFGTPGDFSTIKRDEFDADQAAGKFDYGMNMIPVIEAGDFKLAQSKAIERYIAKKVGMMGSTLEEEAWVDAINEHVGDIAAAFGRKESEEKWFKETMPAYMKKLETTLVGSSGFAVGDKVSLADVAMYNLLKDMQPPFNPEFAADLEASYADCPQITAIVDSLSKHAALQKWLEERPKSTVE